MWEFLSRKRFSLTRVLTDIRYFTTQFYVIFFRRKFPESLRGLRGWLRHAICLALDLAPTRELNLPSSNPVFNVKTGPPPLSPCTTLSYHSTFPAHFMDNNIELVPLELVTLNRDAIRKAREAFLITKGKTFEPYISRKIQRSRSPSLRKAKTRQNRSETPPHAMKTQVIHTTRKGKSILLFSTYFELFCTIVTFP